MSILSGIVVKARYKAALPLLPDLTITSASSGYREMVHASSMPAVTNCSGNLLSTNDVNSVASNGCCPQGLVLRAGQCVCPGLLSFDSGSGQCVCDPNNVNMNGCESGQKVETSDCTCDPCRSDQTQDPNDSRYCICKDYDRIKSKCAAQGQGFDDYHCQCEDCEDTQVLDADTGSCTCPATQAEIDAVEQICYLQNKVFNGNSCTCGLECHNGATPDGADCVDCNLECPQGLDPSGTCRVCVCPGTGHQPDPVHGCFQDNGD